MASRRARRFAALALLFFRWSQFLLGFLVLASGPSSSNGAGLSSLNSRLKTERSPAQYRPIEPDSRVDHSTPVQACSHADLLLPAEKACQMPAAKPPGHRRQAKMYEHSHLSLSHNLFEASNETVRPVIAKRNNNAITYWMNPISQIWKCFSTDAGVNAAITTQRRGEASHWEPV